MRLVRKGAGLEPTCLRTLRVETERKLLIPIEFRTSISHRVIAIACTLESTRDVTGMRGDLVGDAALMDLLTVRETKVLGRRHITKERGSVGRGRGRADRGDDVVVARGDIRRHRTEHVERSLVADFLLTLHVHLNLIERHVTGTLDHDLHAAFAATVDEFAENVEFAELRGVRSVRQAARTESVTERHGDVVLDEDVEDLVPVRVKRILDLVLHHPLGHDRATARNNAHLALHRNRDVLEKKARMERHEVDALFGLRADDVQEERRIHLRDVALKTRNGLVDRHGAERRRACVQHALTNRLEVVGTDGKIHYEIGLAIERDFQLLEFVAFPRVRDAAAEVGVDLGREHAADTDRVRVLVVDVQGNHRLARSDRGTYGLDVNVLFGGHDSHGLGNDALTGSLQLRHSFSSAGITLVRFSGLISAAAHRARLAPRWAGIISKNSGDGLRRPRWAQACGSTGWPSDSAGGSVGASAFASPPCGASGAGVSFSSPSQTETETSFAPSERRTSRTPWALRP